MVLPLSDEPNPRGVPWVNYLLLATNVAVYVLITLPLSFTPADPRDPVFAQYVEVLRRQLGHRVSLEVILSQLSAYDLFVFLHGFKPGAPEIGDLFACMFLHANFLHLFGNMLFLWIYGDNVEHHLGHVRYFVWYLVTGVAATLFHAFFFSSSLIPLVGASGAISGVLGFYFRWFPYNRIRLLVLIFPLFMNVIYLPARLVLGFYLLVDNLLPFLVTYGQDGTGVAFGAHLGGFLAGLAASVWYDKVQLERAPREFSRRVPSTVRGTAQAVVSAIQAGNMEEAAMLFFRLGDEDLRKLDREEVLALAEWLRDHTSPRAALAALLRALHARPEPSTAAALHVAAAELFVHDLREPTLAYQHLVDASRSNPDPGTIARVRALARDIRRQQKLQVGRPRRPGPLDGPS